MLEILRCPDPATKSRIFSDFDPRGQTWVVSDLQSKWHLQKTLLARHGVLEDTTVMRATELWRQFAFQLRPDMRLLSPELAQTMFWDWIEPMNLPWARTPRAVQVVLQQMQMWMTMFSDPQASEIMAQWFADQPESYVRWGHWFELCATLWERCQEQRLMMVAWLPALLLSEDLSRLQWKRSLTFDLGPQVSQVEGLLVRGLGEQGDVRVLYPDAPWIGLMRGALRPYEEILEKTEDNVAPWQPGEDSRLGFERFSTQLAEVKDAVARVRGWLDAGIPAQEIALVAADIEEYWPVLRLYLQQEGIPVCKPETARLGGFVEMAKWLASLRTAMQKISSGDLEIHFFAQQDKPRLSFDQFRILFSHVYDAGDLNRARKHFEAPSVPTSREPQTLQDFLLWSLRLWDASADSTRLLALLQVLGKEVPREVQLRPLQWLSYFEGLLARRELNLKAADESGIWCVSLSSANWLEVRYGVILNLSEGALRQVVTSQVSTSEAQKIFTDTGYALGSPDRQELEFDFLWLLQRPWQELHLSFAATDFSGNVMTPSRLWMWSGILNEQWKKEPQAPGLTRWDEIQHQSTAEMRDLRQWTPAHFQGLELGLKRDVDASVSTWKPAQETRVSASSLERYMECPFIFAAQRVLKQSDDPVLDLDLDRRTRGNLLHALVEALLAEPLRWDWRDQELAELVDQTRSRLEIQVGEERLWPAVRAQHVNLSKLFIAFEKQWRARFPLTTTIGRESAFECYWNIDEGRPTADVTSIRMSGRLDRVDRDSQGRYALIDYKASSQNLRNWSSWLKNNDLQMALYAMLIEAGLAGFDSGTVAAANYYVVRESDRRKGFHFKEPSSELYSADDKHRNWIETESKELLFKELREKIQIALKNILAGDLNPRPEDIKICERCSWRTLCRAPHLN